MDSLEQTEKLKQTLISRPDCSPMMHRNEILPGLTPFTIPFRLQLTCEQIHGKILAKLFMRIFTLHDFTRLQK